MQWVGIRRSGSFDIREAKADPTGESTVGLAGPVESVAGEATIDRIASTKYRWEGMYSDVREYISACESCAVCKKTTRPKFAPLQPMKNHSKLERWNIDLLGKLPVSNPDGFQYIVVAVENFTRYVEIWPVKNATAVEVCECIYDIITRYGCFNSLVSDLGSNLTAEVTKRLTQNFGIKHTFTSSYKASSNCVVELQNKNVWNYLRAYCDDQAKWPDYLKPLLFSMRSLASPKSGLLSPAELMFGQPMKLPIDSMLWKEDGVPKNAVQYMKLMKERSEVLDKVVKENREEAQQLNKKYYDKGSTIPKFQLGNTVLLLNKTRKVGTMTKMLPIWIGPYIITQVGSNNSFKLRHSITDKPVPHTVNGDRLKTL